MILLVTSSKRGVECATVLQQALAEPVQLADNVRRATSVMRHDEYSAVVLDDAMVDADPDAVDILLNTSGMAVPVYVNLALSNSARVVREVRLALRRAPLPCVPPNRCCAASCAAR
jgi:DNA-binding NtrC family response regulator